MCHRDLGIQSQMCRAPRSFYSPLHIKMNTRFSNTRDRLPDMVNGGVNSTEQHVTSRTPPPPPPPPPAVDVDWDVLCSVEKSTSSRGIGQKVCIQPSPAHTFPNKCVLDPSLLSRWRVSVREIWSQNSFIFFESHHSFTSFSLSYALTIDSYDLSYAFPFHSRFQNRKSDLIGVLKAGPLLVQTSQECVLVSEVTLEVKVLSVIGAPMPILLGRLDPRVNHPLRRDLLSLGARGGVPGWDIASTLQGNG